MGILSPLELGTEVIDGLMIMLFSRLKARLLMKELSIISLITYSKIFQPKTLTGQHKIQMNHGESKHMRN